MLQEFHKLLQKANITDATLSGRINNAYVFHVTFENGTSYAPIDNDAAEAIGVRMMFQLVDHKRTSDGWMGFRQNYKITPDVVIRQLASALKQRQKDMTVIILVDGLQKLPHTPGKKDTTFYGALACMANLVNSSNAFVITCCAATVTVPVNEVLSDSPQKRVYLTIPLLDGSRIFQKEILNPINNLLVNDMGGHGRALETLYEIWKKDTKLIIPKLMDEVKTKLISLYPEWVASTELYKPVLNAVLSNFKLVDANTVVPRGNTAIIILFYM